MSLVHTRVISGSETATTTSTNPGPSSIIGMNDMETSTKNSLEPTPLTHPPLPFTKCHTDGNDFILVESSSLASLGPFIPQPHILAHILCNRRTGIGGDGLILISPGSRTGDTATNSNTVDLWNSDGSKAEISGNGTCCVAASVMWKGFPGVVNKDGGFFACTGAGRRGLRFIRRDGSGTGNQFHFVVDMGVPVVNEVCADMRVRSSTESVEATILNVGNPQCALIYGGALPPDWKTISTEIATDARFPDGVNISFSRVLDRHTLATAFFERGAGETSSSGTGSIGAAVAAILRGFAESPIPVRTESGSLRVLWEGPGSKMELEGHAEVVAEGEFFASLYGATQTDRT